MIGRKMACEMMGRTVRVGERSFDVDVKER
jgi:hypothetical protein